MTNLETALTAIRAARRAATDNLVRAALLRAEAEVLTAQAAGGGVVAQGGGAGGGGNPNGG